MKKFLEGFEKKAAESSFVKDFMGGVDPTGLYTFNSAKRNAQKDISGKRHDAHRAVATAGGVIGGGALLAPAISGTIDAIRGGFSTKGGIRKRLLGAGKGFISGFKEPFQQIRHGIGGGRNLRKGNLSGAAENIKYFANQHTDAAKSLGLNPSQRVGEHLFGKVDRSALADKMTTEGYKGLSSLGMSGGISGAAAYLQYGGGRSTGDEIRKLRIQANQRKKRMRGK